MKKIIISLAIIAVAAVVAVGATTAFFSDTEVSSGNTFSAGAIDLLIGNDSWYHGPNGTVARPDLTWQLDNLTGHLFFDYDDLKPGDWGEDTVEIQVQDNDAWACVNLYLTENDDESSTEPELEAGDVEDDPADLLDGELASEVYFYFWVDDGDNVFEQGEATLTYGPASEALQGGLHYPLADSVENNVGGNDGDPLTGGEIYHIGKFWCYGELTPNPVAAGQGTTPADDPGFLCNGQPVTNVSQTDNMVADISFYAVQSRNNPNYICPAGDGCFDQADVMLVLDRSGSISSSELAALKTAALAFVTAMNPDSGVHMGQSSFADTGSLDLHLTGNMANITAAINGLGSGGMTNLYEGLMYANQELADSNTAYERPAVPDYMVVITDGNPNRPLSDPTGLAEAEADAARAAGVEIYVVGVGNDVNATWLSTEIADDANHYFSANDYSALQATLEAIANCQ